jgi:hypothetical protein
VAPIVFKDRWREQVERTTAKDPVVAWHYGSILRSLRRGTNPALVSAITQRWGVRRYDWYDAAAVAEIGLCLGVGHLLCGGVPIGEAPRRDRDRRTNRAILEALPDPFSATVARVNSDADGWFTWEQSVPIEHELMSSEYVRVVFEPGGLPLDIGATDPETTIWHIRSSGGVARWPYDQSSLFLFLSTGPLATPRPWVRPRHHFERGEPYVQNVADANPLPLIHGSLQ